jgi:omega-amidase
MQDLTVTLVQATQVWEDKAANLAHFEQVLADVRDTDLVLLPEMFHTSFTMNAEALAENLEDSMALRWLQAQAAAKNAAFYTSFIAQENGHFYNRGIFVFPAGDYVLYDKRQLFSLAGEDQVYTAGTHATIVD